MNPLKQLGLTFLQVIQQAWALPRTIANAMTRRQQQTIADDLEAERLDRIRNPSKYLGK
jgi:hypothetical protein